MTPQQERLCKGATILCGLAAMCVLGATIDWSGNLTIENPVARYVGMAFGAGIVIFSLLPSVFPVPAPGSREERHQRMRRRAAWRRRFIR